MSFPDLVIWAGPVNGSQVPGATVPGAVQKFIPCTGDGKPPAPKCGNLATLSGGRVLPGILARLNLSEASVGKIYLGAFSAGGHIWKRLLMSQEDRARITGVMLHDAAYEAFPSKNPQPVQGFVEFGVDASKDPSKFLLMTASVGQNPSVEKPGVVYQSGAETMRATIAAINLRTGGAIQEAGALAEGLPTPTRLWTCGKNMVFAQYDNVGHGGQANMAPVFWKSLLQPWIARSDKSPPGVKEDESFFGTGWLVATLVVSVGAAWYLKKRFGKR